jgi:hypothetical protein
MTARGILAVALPLMFGGAQAKSEQRFALIIGANAGWTNDRPLRHAESDARRIRDVLVELGQFPQDRVTSLRDPDTAEVRAQLRRMSQTARSLDDRTLVFVYYSGHADDRFLHLRGAPLGFDEIYETLRDMPATIRVGVFDACRSGSILAAKGGTPAALFDVKILDELTVHGLALLTSSGADELSQEQRALQGSVFTHHLVSGLRGAADSDHDGQVTLSEAYRYAYQRTVADTAGTLVPQRPAFRYEIKGQGDLVMTWPSKAAAAFVLPRADNRRFVVVDEHEMQLIAESRSASDRDVVVALPPGHYHVKEVLPDTLRVAALILPDRAQVKASTLSFTSMPLSSGFVKGAPNPSDPDEMIAFRRSQAMGLLAAGDAGAALGVFEGILKQQPNDWSSQRGKARCLVRLAEGYDRVGDHDNERNYLRAAMEADPSLSEDPDFEAWYRRIQEVEATRQREAEVKKSVEEEMSRNPRLRKQWGLGFDLISSRGAAVISGTYIFKKILFPSLAFDIAGPGFDAELKLVPFDWSWSPYVSVGGHLALYYITGFRWDPSQTQIHSTTNGANSSFDYLDVFGKSFHADIGVQFFGRSGFSAELGLGIVVGWELDKALAVSGWPNLALAWYF